MSIKDMNIVITGATGGMGAALSEALADDGAGLALADVSAEATAKLADKLTGRARSVVAGSIDITDEDSVSAFFDRAKQSLGQLDVLLNLPGLSIASPISEMDVDAYDRIFDVNVKGAFLAAKHYLSRVDDAGGLIMNVASMASKRANPNAPVYCAAKAAVAMFDEGLALQAVKQNVRVTTLNPGAANTAFWGDRPVPREKFLQPGDIVDAVRFVLNMPPRIVVHEVAFESFEFLKSK